MRSSESTATASLDLPLPSRNFDATRRVLQIVLAASILIPLLCLLGYGYYDYQRRIADADDVIDRLARVAQEHALKVFDLDNEMVARIVDLLGDADDTYIAAHEQQVHERLSAIGGDFPQIASTSILSSTGTLLASNRYYPVPKVPVESRDDFLAARAARPEPYFSLPLPGAVQQHDIFTTNMGRISADGRFLGVVSVGLRRAYFAGFYSELLGGNPALMAGLYRQDGGIVVRFPGDRADVSSPADAAFTAALRDNLLFGRVQMKSAADDVDRLIAFRRVGNYPVYVVTGYAIAAIYDQWWRHVALVAGIAGVPCIAVWVLVLFSMRQLKAQQLAWERWQAEVAMRLSAEASSRQLRRMGALGNLVANVAHDLNNLLMVVSTNMGLARRKGFNNLEREVQAVERAIAGAESLARRLLSVARKQPLKQEPIDLGNWLTVGSSLIQTAVGETVRLSVNVVPDVWQVFVDPAELEFAIINVAVNARDAMPGGGRFVIRCQNVRVSASDEKLPDGEYVLMALSDDGEGMTADVAKRAFEPLFTTKERGAGTGLGLAQVLAACEQAGGTARIDSVPGRGTTVRLYLPRHVTRQQGEPRSAAPAVAAEVAPQAVEETRLAALQGSVLLVEDNEEVAAGVAAVLEVFGVRVHHATTAHDALRVLNEGESFDLVLSDIQMPGQLNGIDLAERVRASWPSLKIALMTGYADEIERARHIGIPILAKPFDIDELHALVRAGRE